MGGILDEGPPEQAPQTLPGGDRRRLALHSLYTYKT